MAPHRVKVLAFVVLIAVWPAALRAEAPTARQAEGRAAPPPGESPPPAADAKKAEDAWYAPLKDMKVGPGSLSIDASLRLRYEYTDNFDVPTYNTGLDDDVWLLRTRVGFDYRFTKDVHAYVQFQDARHYGYYLDRDQFALSCPFFDQVDVKQAFVEAKRIGGSPFGFKIGRQAISYADNRVFGPGDWGNVGRYWWDAAKLYIDTERVQVDLLFGQRVLSEQVHWNEKHFDFDMFGAYAQLKKLPFQLDAFYVCRYDDHNAARRNAGRGHERRHSVGAYAKGAFAKSWDYQGTLVAQFGRFGRNEIEAYAACAGVGYTFDHPWKPRLAGEFSYASGDRDRRDKKTQTFDGVFGAIDTFYGRMNLLSWMNILDYQATASITPRKNLTFSCDYHYLTLASDADAWYYGTGSPSRLARTGGSGTYLGQEVDLLVKWNISKEFELFAGYAHFFGGSVVADTRPGRNDADWVFVQLMYSF